MIDPEITIHESDFMASICVLIVALVLVLIAATLLNGDKNE